LKVEVKSWQEETKACPEKWEAIPEQMEFVAEHQKVPNEEATVETIGAVEDRYEDQQPALGYQNPWEGSSRAILYKEPLGDRRSGTDDGHGRNSTTA
jgi:hypothetical protein